MEKQKNQNMINIPAELGIREKKQNNNRIVIAGIIVTALLIFCTIGIYCTMGKPPITKDDFPGCYAIIEGECVNCYRKDYHYVISVLDELKPVEKNFYCYEFRLTGEVTESLQLNSNGNMIVEVDEELNIEQGKIYQLPIYEGGKYLSDFYPIDSGLQSVKRDGIYYLLVDSLEGSLDYLRKKH